MKYTLLTALLILFCGCGSEREFAKVKKLSEYKETSFATTPQETLPKGKNVVYCTTLLLAWQEVKQAVKLPLTINDTYPDLLRLNQSSSHANTLAEGEYKTTVDVDDDEGVIFARAEFAKSLPFEHNFKAFDKALTFKNEPVKAFGVKSDEGGYCPAVVLYYNDDNDFIVKLLPFDKEHEIILYMAGETPATMDELITTVADKTAKGKDERKDDENYWKFDLYDEGDELLIPQINFNIETNFDTLEGNSFTAANKPFTIEKAWQRTAFILDESGAEIESEAETTVTTETPTGPIEKPHPQKLHFNKPFFIMLKRVDSPNPYFAMWIENTELLVKN